MYSYRIEQAIRAATVLHKKQVRKGEFPLPYSTHLMSVAFMLTDYTDDENIIVAALLHDTLEDTDYTEPELIDDFGVEVASIVKAVTEPKRDDWVARKEKYEKQVAKHGEAAMLVSCADKIHNMRTTVEEYTNDHARFRHDFGEHISERLMHYMRLGNLFNRSLKNDIVHEFNHVFTEYKNFIEDVEKSKEPV